MSPAGGGGDDVGRACRQVPAGRGTFCRRLSAPCFAARLVYLARYGADVGWMNLNYLAHARAIALGLHQTFEERPLTYLALGGGAAARARARGRPTSSSTWSRTSSWPRAPSGIARFVWPAASARRRAALCATLALVPLLATHTGRDNLGVTLAAGPRRQRARAGGQRRDGRAIGPATIAALVLAAVSAALGDRRPV